MNVAHASSIVVLAVLLAMPATESRAADATAGSNEIRAPRTLRSATFVAAPAAPRGGRYRLNASLHPAPAPAFADGARGLKLDAVLAPKAGVASCPMPGSIFADGYESP